MLPAPDSCSGGLGGRCTSQAETISRHGPRWTVDARARGPAHLLAATDRFDRDLDWPARVLADADAPQGETGPAGREAVRATSTDLASGCMLDDKPRWPALARITLKFSCKGFQ